MHHGGDLAAFAKQFQKKPGEILDFSSNINPFGLPEKAEILYREAFKEIHRYPEPYAESFCEILAEIFEIAPDRVLAGNGSFSLLDLAVRALSPQKVLLVEPGFSEYRRLALMAGASITEIRVDPENNFSFDLRNLTEKLSHVDTVILGHPNNPTGTALERKELLCFIESAARQNVFVLLDEAFVDWVPDLSVAGCCRETGNVLVVRSLTKFYALAGLRSGFALGPPSLIGRMKALQGPWSCNRPAVRLSSHLIRDTSFQEMSRQRMTEEKAWLREQLKKTKDLRIFPSLANFFLVQTPMNAGALFEALGEQGLYIRLAGNFRGLDNSFFRVAVKTREENERLVEAIEQYASLRDSAPVSRINPGQRLLRPPTGIGLAMTENDPDFRDDKVT